MIDFSRRQQKEGTTAMSKPAGRMLVGAALAAVLVSPAAAQDFPGGKPIEMTVMFGAGSAADVTARRLADGMAKTLGVPVAIVNRTGAGGAFGYAHVSQQKPDGFSIVWSSNSISTTFHSGKLDFDYTAFDAVARVSVETPVLAVRANAPWKSLKDLISHAKTYPDKVRIGNSGAGSHTHLAASALFTSASARVVHLPFGAGQAVVSLLANRIEGSVQMPPAFVPQVHNGDLRILAVLGSKQEPAFPDAPTAQKLGYTVILDMWRGIAVPKGTPKPVIARLEEAIRKTVDSAEFQQAGKDIGFTPAFLPADEFSTLIARDDLKLAQVMKDLGLKKN
jgi:tripartite-type tricarboxylate transporter receptor subunit TctC